MKTMNKQQLEIGLPVKPCVRRVNRRQQRLDRARWWFTQMRRVVDQAGEWKPARRTAAESR